MRSNFFSAAALLAVAQLVAAQTSTECQPLEKSKFTRQPFPLQSIPRSPVTDIPFSSLPR